MRGYKCRAFVNHIPILHSPYRREGLCRGEDAGKARDGGKPRMEGEGGEGVTVGGREAGRKGERGRETEREGERSQT